jgi:hypothetical protein
MINLRVVTRENAFPAAQSTFDGTPIDWPRAQRLPAAQPVA